MERKIVINQFPSSIGNNENHLDQIINTKGLFQIIQLLIAELEKTADENPLFEEVEKMALTTGDRKAGPRLERLKQRFGTINNPETEREILGAIKAAININTLSTMVKDDPEKSQLINGSVISYYKLIGVIGRQIRESFKDTRDFLAQIGVKNMNFMNNKFIEKMKQIFKINDFEKIIEELEKIGVCFLDLIGLKAANDHLGHEAGDYLIKELHTALKNPQLKTKLEKIGVAILESIGLTGDEVVVIIKSTDEKPLGEKKLEINRIILEHLVNHNIPEITKIANHFVLVAGIGGPITIGRVLENVYNQNEINQMLQNGSHIQDIFKKILAIAKAIADVECTKIKDPIKNTVVLAARETSQMFEKSRKTIEPRLPRNFNYHDEKKCTAYEQKLFSKIVAATEKDERIQLIHDLLGFMEKVETVRSFEKLFESTGKQTQHQDLRI